MAVDPAPASARRPRRARSRTDRGCGRRRTGGPRDRTSAPDRRRRRRRWPLSLLEMGARAAMGALSVTASSSARISRASLGRRCPRACSGRGGSCRTAPCRVVGQSLLRDLDLGEQAVTGLAGRARRPGRSPAAEPRGPRARAQECRAPPGRHPRSAHRYCRPRAFGTAAPARSAAAAAPSWPRTSRRPRPGDRRKTAFSQRSGASRRQRWRRSKSEDPAAGRARVHGSAPG